MFSSMNRRSRRSRSNCEVGTESRSTSPTPAQLNAAHRTGGVPLTSPPVWENTDRAPRRSRRRVVGEACPHLPSIRRYVFQPGKLAEDADSLLKDCAYSSGVTPGGSTTSCMPNTLGILILLFAE